MTNTYDSNVYSWLMVKLNNAYNNIVVRIVRKLVLVYALFSTFTYAVPFYYYSHEMAVNMSNPSIMFQARLQDGTTIMVDDYREAYWWLRDNTPEDARVMAWWDYGYQLAGIANRIVRHLADYVLIWTGGGGDDLAKSPHMARIGNSVFEDICPGDPTCRHFGFVDQQQTPTPSMAA